MGFFKFVVKVYGEPIIKNGEEYKNCIACLSSNSLKRIKQYTQDFKDKHPDKKIVTKERTGKGWIEIEGI